MGHGFRLVCRHCSLELSLTIPTVDLVPRRDLVLSLLMGQEKLTAALSPVLVQELSAMNQFVPKNEFISVGLRRLVEALRRLDKLRVPDGFQMKGNTDIPQSLDMAMPFTKERAKKEACTVSEMNAYKYGSYGTRAASEWLESH